MEDLPFKCWTNLLTDNWGGTDTSRWIWSLDTCPCNMSTSLALQICRISSRSLSAASPIRTAPTTLCPPAENVGQDGMMSAHSWGSLQFVNFKDKNLLVQAPVPMEIICKINSENTWFINLIFRILFKDDMNKDVTLIEHLLFRRMGSYCQLELLDELLTIKTSII